MIRIKNLSKRIPGGPKVLDDISFEVYPGDFVAIKGESGSGKSMLLRCLALQEKWTEGSYIFDGKDVFKQGFSAKLKVKQQVAYVEEKPFLFPNKTGLKNVIIGSVTQTPAWRRWTGMVRNDDYMGAMDMIEKRGLIDKAHQKASTLSGGERQRMAIARALVHGAKVIAADEPIAGLDPHTADLVLTDLKALCKEQGVIVIAIMHQGDWAERFADRILGLKNGKLVLDVTGRKLTAREKLLL
ncbi:phosphonate ABC transporter ATP-binding protein [Paenibacillus sp. FSL H8-0548]|uniref:phosphonate ABC transporter ATP-binding protein n=1 Tax=Paenibacillus sp. FSL H8-0548 TaxID=1920422 RepID=UPI00096BDD8B|nr:ATP-binding cassette domain-containing protein [Paenibacillus sp. FSL H8-0548]OMF38307.1 phosphonate ABC transporter ATP-binding protein [Paenibacillus sp. FSL H8-0548]